jgi:glycosyltransferase involved in cell wall biosynthesis
MNGNRNFRKLSIVIPVYNEIDTFMIVIKQVQAVKIPLEKEIVLVDDCSTDGTKEKIREMVEDDNVKKVYHQTNLGKGAALRSGFKVATGDIVLVQDADFEYNPDDYPSLLKPILDGKADVVYGSRFFRSGTYRVPHFWHVFGNKLLTVLSNIFSNLNLSDMETCYKVFSKEILDHVKLVESRFGFEPEITAKISRLGCRVYEVGVSYTGRKYDEGKKVGWRDGLSALRCIIKYNIFDR